MNRLALSLVVVLATSVTGALMTFDAVTWVRIPVILAFALLVPGLGWAWRLRLSDIGDTLLLAVTISVCSLVVVGEGMALLRAWSIERGFLVLAAVAVVGAAVPPRESNAARPDAPTKRA